MLLKLWFPEHVTKILILEWFRNHSNAHLVSHHRSITFVPSLLSPGTCFSHHSFDVPKRIQTHTFSSFFLFFNSCWCSFVFYFLIRDMYIYFLLKKTLNQCNIPIFLWFFYFFDSYNTPSKWGNINSKCPLKLSMNLTSSFSKSPNSKVDNFGYLFFFLK